MHPRSFSVTVSFYKVHMQLEGSNPDPVVRGAGEYNEVWDCRDNRGNYVPTGIYFCVLKSGKTKLSQPLVVIK